MTSKRVFILIPSYNEANVIRKTIASLQGPYEIVLIDDASTDNTSQVVAGLPIYYLRHTVNLGQGAALQTGMTFAYQQGADIVVHFDADGQHNPNDIPRFIDELESRKLDVVLGSRFLLREDRVSVPAFKQVILKVATLINGIITGLWLTDAHNGFRVMNRRSLGLIRLKENRMAHATEILAEIYRHKLNVVEMSTHITYTDYSKAKGQSWTNSLNILFDLFVNRYLRS
ncbi:glycosyltransferase family 2 protein [Spirosoma panaciterrae]|uniref:glycosyltransferase family 2 protein n=1 Tax=Spirosoma panaciterrae TaxID=496058 RepID=UPI00037B6EA2|nr:glycosyltransferase family 2 protein [Spirosoma panaciterrae]